MHPVEEGDLIPPGARPESVGRSAPARPRTGLLVPAQVPPDPASPHTHTHTPVTTGLERCHLPGQQQASLGWLLSQVPTPSDGPALGDGDGCKLKSCQVPRAGRKDQAGVPLTSATSPPRAQPAVHPQGTPAPPSPPGTHRGPRGRLGALLLPGAHNAGPQLGRDIGDMGRAGDGGRVQGGQVRGGYSRPAGCLQVQHHQLLFEQHSEGLGLIELCRTGWVSAAADVRGWVLGGVGYAPSSGRVLCTVKKSMTREVKSSVTRVSAWSTLTQWRSP